jgi:hypothetical protein
MVCRISQVFIIAAAFAIGLLSAAPTMAAPFYSSALSQSADLDQRVSFWGMPYPYGYSYRPYGVRSAYRHRCPVVSVERRLADGSVVIDQRRSCAALRVRG